jgi:hypothetical protein
MMIDIQPHEQKALEELMINTRAMVGVLGREREHCVKLMVWAQMVEDLLERMYQEQK